MDRSGVLVFLIIGGYLAFEIYGVHSSKHLMEPGHIYGKYIGAQYAAEACEAAADADQDQFAKNLKVMRRKTRAALAEANADASASAIDEQLNDLTASKRAEVDVLLAEQGCDGKGIFTLLKTYEQSSRLRLQ